MTSDVPRHVRLSIEEYRLWESIRELAEQRKDEDGVFPMTFREVSELTEQEGYGATLIAPLEKAGIITKAGKRFLRGPKTPPDVPGGRVSSLWQINRSVDVILDEEGGKDIAATASDEREKEKAEQDAAAVMHKERDMAGNGKQGDRISDPGAGKSNAERVPPIFSDVSVEVVGFVDEDGWAYIRQGARRTGGRASLVGYRERQKVMRIIHREKAIRHSTLLQRLSYCLKAEQINRIIELLFERGMVRQEQREGRKYYRWVGPDDRTLNEPQFGDMTDEVAVSEEGFIPIGQLSGDELARQGEEPVQVGKAHVWAYRDLCASVTMSGRVAKHTLLLMVKKAVLELKQQYVRQEEALRRKVHRLEASLASPEPAEIPKVQRRQLIYSPLRERWVPETPEERVRQEYVVILQTDYGYSVEQMEEEAEVTGPGSGSARADLVVWRKAEDRAQGARPLIVVECKSRKTPLNPQHFWQGENYARLAGASFLVTTNGKEARYWRIQHDRMPKSLQEVNDIPLCPRE